MTSNLHQLIESARPLSVSFLNAIVSVATHPMLLTSQHLLVRVAALALLTLALTLSGTSNPQTDSPC